MPYIPPEFKDHDTRHPVSAEVLRQLGGQYAAVVQDAKDPESDIGRVIAQAAAEASVGFVDNGDGTLTLSSGLYRNNGDGTITIGE